MDSFERSRLCSALLAELGIHDDVVVTESIQIGRLAGVERVRLPDRSTRIFKYTIDRFSTENRVLTSLAEQGIPVPRLDASAVGEGVLTMLMQDLGPHTVEATARDGAALAAQLHTVGPAPWLENLNEAALALLPDRALDYLETLNTNDRVLAENDTLADLAALDRAARRRAVGAELAPWGFCHGQLHPSAVHIGASGRHVLDFALAINGPGLLDLAAWPGRLDLAAGHGLRQPPDFTFIRDLIQLYVDVGGHAHAFTDRGGLPAERWALGWYRLHAATWRLGRAVTGIDGEERDSHNRQILRDQIRDARQLLAP